MSVVINMAVELLWAIEPRKKPTLAKFDKKLNGKPNGKSKSPTKGKKGKKGKPSGGS